MAEEKAKALNPKALTVEVMDLDGKNYTLTGRVVPRKGLADFNRVMFEEALTKPVEDQVAFQMSYLYGKPQEFWDNFDLRVLNQAVKVFLLDIRNPLM